MRVALNPFASTVGYLLPYVVSGSIIVSLVLSLPTVGPLLLRALVAQDMFLAGTIVLLLGVMTVIGTLPLRPPPDVDRPPHPPGGPAIAEPGASSAAAPEAASLPAQPSRRPKSGSPSPPSGSSCGGASAATSWPWLGTVVVVLFYAVVVFADFLAYAIPTASEAQRSLLPPQRIHWFDEGRFAPHVYGLSGRRDPMTLQARLHARPEKKIPVRFFARGFEYRLLGLIPTDRHICSASRAARRRNRSSSSAPTSRGATSGRDSCTGRAPRSPSAWPGWP